MRRQLQKAPRVACNAILDGQACSTNPKKEKPGLMPGLQFLRSFMLPRRPWTVDGANNRVTRKLRATMAQERPEGVTSMNLNYFTFALQFLDLAIDPFIECYCRVSFSYFIKEIIHICIGGNILRVISPFL